MLAQRHGAQRAREAEEAAAAASSYRRRAPGDDASGGGSDATPELAAKLAARKQAQVGSVGPEGGGRGAEGSQARGAQAGTCGGESARVQGCA